jgi:hypothetical protein
MRVIGKSAILSHIELAKSLALDECDDLSPEEEALAEILTLLIEDYEEKHYPLPRVSPNASTEAQRHMAHSRQQGRHN